MTLADLTGPSAPATITVPEASEVIGVSAWSGYQAAKRGEIPTLTLGRRILVPVPALLKILGADD